ncbi:hypothetical protein RZS08_46985, partial [Arthrospira platensis SPKY1]|nr:hypothetical protein [Arthrospira platensis SPKY1]
QIRQRAGHVPLADECGAVASALQRFKKGLVVWIPGRHVVHHSVAAGELAGQDRSARRAAYGRGDERVVSDSAL